MPQELGLLVVFLLVFLFDTFGPKRSQSSLPVLTAVLFGIFTVCNGFMLMRGTAFSGMFESTAATYVMKVILNIGVLIVLIQSIKWANSEEMAIRRGEFYELLLLTVLGAMTYQFIMPIISNGEGDLAKHMFAYVQLVDLLVVLILVWVGYRLSVWKKLRCPAVALAGGTAAPVSSVRTCENARAISKVPISEKA